MNHAGQKFANQGTHTRARAQVVWSEPEKHERKMHEYLLRSIYYFCAASNYHELKSQSQPPALVLPKISTNADK